MQAVMVVPSFTEIGAMKDRLLSLNPIQVLGLHEVGDWNIKEVRHLFVDLSFDFFDPRVEPPFLWHVFADYYRIIQDAEQKGIDITLIRNYPFSTNSRNWNLKQRLVEQFIRFSAEFYGAYEVFVPDLISRGGLKKLKHPLFELIESVRMGKVHRSRVTENSRFFILYDLDFMESLLSHLELGIHEPLVIEGNELSMKQINEAVQVAIGSSPVSFHHTNFLKGHYPDVICGKTLNEVHYEFENILIDLVSSLF